MTTPRKNLRRQSNDMLTLARRLRGDVKVAILGDENGIIDDTARLGMLRVRNISGADLNGNATYSAYYLVRQGFGAAIVKTAGREVVIQRLWDGQYYATGGTWDDMTRAGYDPSQTNSLDRRSQYFSMYNAVELISKATSIQGATSFEVTVYPLVYEKPDGTFGIFSGTSDGTGNAKLDLTAYVPAASDDQCVVVTWLNTYANTVSVTVSSDISQDTNLYTRDNLATLLGLINECAATRPVDAIPSRVFVVRGDATYIEVRDELQDLRPWLHSPDKFGFPLSIDRPFRVWAGYQQIFYGTLTVNDTLYVDGTLVLI